MQLAPSLTLSQMLNPAIAGPALLTVVGMAGSALVLYAAWLYQGYRTTRQPEPLEYRPTIVETCVLASSLLTSWLLSANAISVVALAAGLWSGPLTALLATLASIVAVVVINRIIPKRLSPKALVILATALLVVAALTVIASGTLVDNSSDGLGYHQEAVTQLLEGWNPVQDVDGAAGALRYYPPFSSELWIEHYPKGTWLQAATLASVLGSLQSGKGTGWMLVLASFAMSLACLVAWPGIPRWAAPILAATLAIGPIASTQLPTFYVDGQLGSLMLLVLAATGLAWVRRELWVPALAVNMCAVALMPGTKLTGLAYALIFLIAIAPILWHSAPSRTIALRGALAGICVLAVAVLLLGFNPYVTNLRDHGSAFYPVTRGSGVAVTENQTPTSFGDRPRIEKLVPSLLADSPDWHRLPVSKIPGTTSRAEWLSYRAPDSAYEGFGPLFSAVLVFVLLLLPLETLMLGAGRLALPSWLFAWLCVSIAVVDAAWWARLVPQLWYMAIGVLIVGLTLGRPLAAGGRHDRVRRAASVLAVTGLTLAAVNAALISAVALDLSAQSSGQAWSDLKYLRENSAEYVVDERELISVGRRLREAGIGSDRALLEDEDSEPLAGSPARFARKSTIAAPADARETGGRRGELTGIWAVTEYRMRNQTSDVEPPFRRLELTSDGKWIQTGRNSGTLSWVLSRDDQSIAISGPPGVDVLWPAKVSGDSLAVDFGFAKMRLTRVALP